MRRLQLISVLSLLLVAGTFKQSLCDEDGEEVQDSYVDESNHDPDQVPIDDQFDRSDKNVDQFDTAEAPSDEPSDTGHVVPAGEGDMQASTSDKVEVIKVKKTKFPASGDKVQGSQKVTYDSRPSKNPIRSNQEQATVPEIQPVKDELTNQSGNGNNQIPLTPIQIEGQGQQLFAQSADGQLYALTPINPQQAVNLQAEGIQKAQAEQLQLQAQVQELQATQLQQLQAQLAALTRPGTGNTENQQQYVTSATHHESHEVSSPVIHEPTSQEYVPRGEYLEDFEQPTQADVRYVPAGKVYQKKPTKKQPEVVEYSASPSPKPTHFHVQRVIEPPKPSPHVVSSPEYVDPSEYFEGPAVGTEQPQFLPARKQYPKVPQKKQPEPAAYPLPPFRKPSKTYVQKVVESPEPSYDSLEYAHHSKYFEGPPVDTEQPEPQYIPVKQYPKIPRTKIPEVIEYPVPPAPKPSKIYVQQPVAVPSQASIEQTPEEGDVENVSGVDVNDLANLGLGYTPVEDTPLYTIYRVKEPDSVEPDTLVPAPVTKSRPLFSQSHSYKSRYHASPSPSPSPIFIESPSPSSSPSPIHYSSSPPPVYHSSPSPSPSFHASPSPSPAYHVSPSPSSTFHASPAPSSVYQVSPSPLPSYGPPPSPSPAYHPSSSPLHKSVYYESSPRPRPAQGKPYKIVKASTTAPHYTESPPPHHSKPQTVFKSSADPDGYNQVKTKLILSFSRDRLKPLSETLKPLSDFFRTSPPKPPGPPQPRRPYGRPPPPGLFSVESETANIQGDTPRVRDFEKKSFRPSPPDRGLFHAEALFESHRRPPIVGAHSIIRPKTVHSPFHSKHVDIDYSPGISLPPNEVAFAALQAKKVGGPAFIDPGFLTSALGFHLNGKVLEPLNSEGRVTHGSQAEERHPVIQEAQHTAPEPVVVKTGPKETVEVTKENQTEKPPVVKPTSTKAPPPPSPSPTPEHKKSSPRPPKVELKDINVSRNPLVSPHLLAKILKDTTGDEFELENYY